MSEYYNPPAAIKPATRAKSEHVNELRQSVETAFDSLPPDLSGLNAEVEAARGSEADLNTRINLSETSAATSAGAAAASEEAAKVSEDNAESLKNSSALSAEAAEESAKSAALSAAQPIPGAITMAPFKTGLSGNDEIGIVDKADGNTLKKIKVSQFSQSIAKSLLYS